jgi:hypothetical protein
MNKLQRRGFLKQVTAAAAGLAAMTTRMRGWQFGIAESATEFVTQVVPLDHWLFGFDPEDHGERQEWFGELSPDFPGALQRG